MKWRGCAQKTAEAVFVTARNRIDRMGGFREFMKNQKQQSTWNDDSQPKRSEEDVDEVEEPPVEEEFEDEFTMDIMLKMAGVEEDLIGWDRELNNFIKK
jgi:Swi5-dependent recombination DNA repair protein 1